MSDVVTFAATAVLSIAGLYFAHSIRRRTQAEIEAHVAEQRLTSYAALWQATLVAAPSGGDGLTKDERDALHGELTKWYFEEGHGMVLAEDSRSIYFMAKFNLTCADRLLRPESLRERVCDAPEPERVALRSAASVRQLSLLRTSMRADLLVYSGPWGQKLDAEDKAFLETCGVSRWHRPWRPTLRKAPPVGPPDQQAQPAELAERRQLQTR